MTKLLVACGCFPGNFLIAAGQAGSIPGTLVGMLSTAHWATKNGRSSSLNCLKDWWCLSWAFVLSFRLSDHISLIALTARNSKLNLWPKSCKGAALHGISVKGSDSFKSCLYFLALISFFVTCCVLFFFKPWFFFFFLVINVNAKTKEVILGLDLHWTDFRSLISTPEKNGSQRKS